MVDDEPAVRGFVRYSLSGANFEVIEATSGTEALATKSVPVMFLTGTILDVDELVQALELDPSDFVTKRELIARTCCPGPVGPQKAGYHEVMFDGTGLSL